MWSLPTTSSCSGCPWGELTSFAGHGGGFHRFLWYNATGGSHNGRTWVRWPWRGHRQVVVIIAGTSAAFIGIFILEAVSVILQVGSYKLRTKSDLQDGSLHHHFELIGWSESKVIVRFWIGAWCLLFALTTLKLR